MALEIIGAGFGRTGTHSLKIALETLGFGPCHHMCEIRKDPDSLKYWLNAQQGKPVDWQEVFRDYKSQVDWPGALYWRHLADAFPTAKIILTLRDPESWLESIINTIYPSLVNGRKKYSDTHQQMVSQMAYDSVFMGLFKGTLADKEYAMSVYREHVETVRKKIPKNRLLEYHAGDGWAPLCQFLNCEVPDIPFSQGNTEADFKANMQSMGQKKPA